MRRIRLGFLEAILVIESGFAFALSTELPVRVVPNEKWPTWEYHQTNIAVLVDPTRRFGVCPSRDRIFIFDLKRKRPAWIIPCSDGAAFSFDREGKELTISGPNAGGLLKLEEDLYLKAEWLRSTNRSAVAYSPDNRFIWLAQGSGSEPADMGFNSARAPDSSGAKTDDVSQFTRYGILCCLDRDGVKNKEWPLAMNRPISIRFPTNSNSIVVEGVIAARLGSKGGGSTQPVTQTIDLETGRSEVVRGTRGPAGGMIKVPPALRGLEELPLPDDSRMLPANRILFAWHEASRRLFLGGFVWQDFERAPVRHDIKATEAIGFDANGAMLAKVFVGGGTDLVKYPKDSLASISLLSRIGERDCVISPDGRKLAAFSRVVLLFDLVGLNPQIDFAFPEGNPRNPQWADNGSLLAAHIAQLNSGALCVWNAEGQLIRQLPCPSSFAFSPDGRLAAIAGKGSESTVEMTPQNPADFDGAVVNLTNGNTLQRVEGFSGTLSCARFISSNQFVTATAPRFIWSNKVERTHSGRIRLWELGREAPVWDVEARVLQESLDYRPSASTLVVNHSIRGAEILSLKDGQMQSAPESFLGHRFLRPMLVGDGSLVLDLQYEYGSTARLIDISTGRTVATFASFLNSDWMVWTPEGFWTGSDGATNWCSFYRGANTMEENAILALRSSEKVRERIHAALVRAGIVNRPVSPR